MYQQFEFCPTCQQTRTMSISIALRKEVTTRGEEVEALVMNLHCNYCQSFVRQLPFEEQDEAVVTEWVASV